MTASTGTASGSAGNPPEAAATSGTATGPTARTVWRGARGPVLVVLGVVVAGVVAGLLALGGSGGTLDPNSYAPSGARALAELLRDGGVEVRRVGTVDQAGAAATDDTVLLLPFPQALAPSELEQLAAAPGRVVVVAPRDEALDALGVPADVRGDVDVEGRDPACVLDVAERAGEVDLGGVTYEPVQAEGALGCYAVDGEATLLQVDDATLLGSGDLLTNDRLDERGNAALALGLLGTADRVVWLIPDPARPLPDDARPSLRDVLPDAVFPVAAQLLLALAVLALWRARRLGRVVEEPLPVVVRAAEAVEGRGRLYRAANARGTAAQALRDGTRERLVRRVGLPLAAPRDAVVATVSGRSRRSGSEVETLLYGAPPADDAALVRLADELRALERDVSTPPPRSDPEAVGT